MSPWWERIFASPPSCFFCSTPVRKGFFSGVWEGVCLSCRNRLSPIRPPFCNRCGRPLSPSKPVSGWICRDCRGHPADRLDGNRSAVRYDPFSREIISLFKYRGREHLARPLGRMMAEVLPVEKWDAVTYVPLHREKLKERGFNQAHLLAREIAGRTGRPLCAMLERIRSAPPQSQRSRKERLTALEGAFRLAEIPGIRGRRVLIVDDVYTTGATLVECARLLKEGGAVRVFSVTFAR